MPTYTYEALNEAGKPQKGQIAAGTSEEAIARIRSQGFFPMSVREQKVKKGSAAKTAAASGAAPKKKKADLSINIGGVSQKVLTTFTRQLSTLQDAGLPILRSLQILEQQQKPGLFKNILDGVHDSVSSGTTLSDAMAAHPKAFNKLYCKMITAGEVGGVLDLILKRLAEFMEKAARLRRRIIGAMIYPAVVITVATVIVIGIMILIVPNFEKIFEDFDTALPALTVFLIASSKWLAGRSYEGQFPGVIFVMFFPLIAFLLFKIARKSDGGKAVIDSVALKLPVMGKLISKTTIAKFTRTLGTLINAGVPILDAIAITKETTGNFIYARALGQVHDSVRQGESFAEPLASAKVCDAIVVNMIDVGEETGDLDQMMIRIADNYDEEVDVLVASLVSLLEPIMVVVLGGIVGFIVIALFLPMVKLITSMM
ncbi:MAG: pilus assembly protein PilC [Phycisphaeraceae bacterium]|nr:pilus assembly protein PilC [Phycisphaeraceae bacterium]